MSFRKELEELINKHSMENGSDTPDFLLTDFLEDSLAAFDRAVIRREVWYGRRTLPVEAPGEEEPDNNSLDLTSRA